MNLGAEPKKIAILGALAVVGGYIFYTNVLAGPETETKKTPARPAPAVSAPPVAGAPNIGRAKVPVRGASQEFRPKIPKRPEDRANPLTTDPSLRLDLLAKVQSVEVEGGSRSLFQFAAAPVTAATQSTTKVDPIKPVARFIGPEPPPKPVPPAAPPPPPPITLKFYGYSSPKADGQKRAFFLDGDDIFVAGEGELIKKRYRVVQIGVNSVIMEDMEHKNNRQTLVLQQEQAS
jgi:hypothetical protein